MLIEWVIQALVTCLPKAIKLIFANKTGTNH